MEEATIVWTEYMKYRLSLRGYDLATVEQILRYSSERYVDTVTGRVVAIGRHEKLIVMIQYELKAITTFSPRMVLKRSSTCNPKVGRGNRTRSNKSGM